MATQDRFYAGIFTVCFMISRLAAQILTPLLYDSLKPTTRQWMNSTAVNNTDDIPLLPAGPTWRTVDPIFCIAASMAFDVVVLGIALLAAKVFWSHTITEREKNHPMKYFAMVGLFQAMSAVLYQYSASGDRTAPYIQALVSYFPIPITFLLRFLILRKRPTLKKGLCALVICVAEMVCLIPTIFPGLESESQIREEGGATGPWRIIWPVICVINIVPHALSNIVLEKTVKHGTVTTPDSDGGRLNMVFTLFWSYTWTFVGVCSLFWADFIPVFGLLSKPSLFGKQMWFNMRCMVGAEAECGAYVVGLFWGRMVTRTASFVSAALLLRYGEGANFYAMTTVAIVPLQFLIWTLVDESPLRWHPHASLSTWLSIGALCVMIPSLVIYIRGPREKAASLSTEEQEPLLGNHRSNNNDKNVTPSRTIQ